MIDSYLKTYSKKFIVKALTRYSGFHWLLFLNSIRGYFYGSILILYYLKLYKLIRNIDYVMSLQKKAHGPYWRTMSRDDKCRKIKSRHGRRSWEKDSWLNRKKLIPEVERRTRGSIETRLNLFKKETSIESGWSRELIEQSSDLWSDRSRLARTHDCDSQTSKKPFESRNCVEERQTWNTSLLCASLSVLSSIVRR